MTPPASDPSQGGAMMPPADGPARATIEARGLGVRFQFDRQQRVLTPGRARLSFRVEDSWGLREVDLSAGPGEGIALIGPTGSGKTTLLRTIAGILPADAGTIEVEGRPASMLSINAGLLPGLTGRENALLLCVLGGLSREEAKGAMDELRERSRLGDAFERPAASYSQGMRARLAFTAALHGGRDLILLDEVHEAFDHEFRDVLEAEARRMLSRGGIVVAAGHDHEILSRLCSRALLLDDGRVRASGAFADVRERYLGTAAPPAGESATGIPSR